jgi:hypothetical protein
VEQQWVVAIKIAGDGNMFIPSVAVGRAKQAETKNAKLGRRRKEGSEIR